MYISGTQSAVEMGKKYFEDTWLCRGWTLLLLLDPELAPFAAAGLRRALALNRGDANPPGLLAAPTPVTATVSVSSPAFAPGAAADSGTNDRWSMNSSTHAFPSVTYAQLQSRVCHIYTKAGKSPAEISGITGLTGACALDDPRILHDLQALADGQLLYTLQDSTDWVRGAPVHTYFLHFKTLFPALADSIQEQFGHVLVASTMAEQGFAVSNNQMHANSSKVTIQQNMHFALNVRKAISSDIRGHAGDNNISEEASSSSTTEETNTANLPTKLFRNHSTRIEYAHQLLDKADILQSNYGQEITPFRTMLKQSKRSVEMSEAAPHVMNEFKKNKLSHHQVGGSTAIIETIQAFTDTTLAGKTTLPEKERTEYEKIAYDNNIWKADRIRAYLMNTGLPEYSEVNCVHYYLRPNDPVDYKDLRMLLAEYWLSQDMSIEDVRNIQT